MPPWPPGKQFSPLCDTRQHCPPFAPRSTTSTPIACAEGAGGADHMAAQSVHRHTGGGCRHGVLTWRPAHHADGLDQRQPLCPSAIGVQGTGSPFTFHLPRPPADLLACGIPFSQLPRASRRYALPGLASVRAPRICLGRREISGEYLMCNPARYNTMKRDNPHRHRLVCRPATSSRPCIAPGKPPS